MGVKAMILMASLGAMTAGAWPASAWALPQQNEVQADADAPTAPDRATNQTTKTNWTPVPLPNKSDEKDSSDYRWNFKNFGLDFVDDQKDIWTSPAKIRFSDATWLLPVAGVSAALFATDRETSRHLSTDPQTIQRYREIANGSVGALAGLGGGFALWSVFTHDDHQRETGFLAGE